MDLGCMDLGFAFGVWGLDLHTLNPETVRVWMSSGLLNVKFKALSLKERTMLLVD